MSDLLKVADWLIIQSSKLAYFLLFVLGFALDAPAPQKEESFSWINKIYESFRDNAWMLIVSCLLMIFIKFIYLVVYRGRADLKKKAEEILNHSREYFIKENYISNDPDHYHRLTLFKHTGFCYWPRPARSFIWKWGKGFWPWTGWLVPVARSGHSTKYVKTTFRVPEDGHGAEGVAGKAFFQDNPFKVPSSGTLLNTLSQSSSPQEIEDFAKATFVNAQWIRSRLQKEKPLSKSLFAFRIKIGGKPWGVVVIDSVASDGILNPADLVKPISYLRYLITNIVEGR